MGEKPAVLKPLKVPSEIKGVKGLQNEALSADDVNRHQKTVKIQTFCLHQIKTEKPQKHMYSLLHFMYSNVHS